MAQQHGHTPAGVDAYGNPVAVHGGGVPVAGTGAQFQPVEQRPRGMLHRSSSSSSSSSSEDDGMGGRRKKGIKQKIKEKLPGGHKGSQPQPGTTAGGTFAQPQGPVVGTYGHAGTGAADTYGHAGMANNTYGQPHAGATGTYGQQGHAGGMTGPHGATGEKKGIMDKIKEKLPGHH